MKITIQEAIKSIDYNRIAKCLSTGIFFRKTESKDKFLYEKSSEDISFNFSSRTSYFDRIEIESEWQIMPDELVICINELYKWLLQGVEYYNGIYNRDYAEGAVNLISSTTFLMRKYFSKIITLEEKSGEDHVSRN